MKFSVRISVALLFLLLSCKQEKISTVEKQAAPKPEKKLCFLQKLDNDGKNLATVDIIEHLRMSDLKTGAVYPQLIELPDGSCYVNKEKKYESYVVATDAKIIMQTFSRDDEGNYRFRQSITLGDLLSKTNASRPPGFLNSPFEIELLNNKIISLVEIYIP